MGTKKYNELIKAIDEKLKNNSFFITVKNYKQERNFLSGLETVENLKKVEIIKRKDQFLIDTDGCFYSLLSEYIQF